MARIDGYAHLTEEDMDGYHWAVSQLYPSVERCYDDTSGRVGFCVPLVATWRGNTYGIYILFPKDYPDREPHGLLDPPIEEAPHRYDDGSICVHDRSYNAEDWSPAIGFTLARCWLEAYEDWYFDGRNFQSLTDIPDDVRERVEAMGG